ncbi:hypothetical protein B4135_1939 [Caldibacillus debilis]|uniref:Uncharacterized protein n=1 Tax=Caldibacillus debilis TaxID=301148 RepID=A0A150M6D3_9BACI|nr:hypothetical protein B4135_1939 [Caldibacillus debilis]
MSLTLICAFAIGFILSIKVFLKKSGKRKKGEDKNQKLLYNNYR